MRRAGISAILIAAMFSLSAAAAERQGLTLQQKTGSPYVFVAVAESWGSVSAKTHAPRLDVPDREQYRYVVLRVTRALKAPPGKTLPPRLLVRIHPEWFSSHVQPAEIQRQRSEGPSEVLFRLHYQDQESVFFGDRLEQARGARPDTLMILRSSP